MTAVAAEVVGVLLLLTMGAPIASASSMTYSIGIGNAAISGYTGPYATVLVDLTTSHTATITFTSNIVGGNIYLLGGVNSAAVNVNATTFSSAFVSCANGGTGFKSCNEKGGVTFGTSNVSEFGTFNLAFKSFGGFANSSDNFVFSLTNTSGTWATPGDVLKANNDGYLAAAHIFVTADPAAKANGALVTGFAGNGGTVPDGGITFMLLGGSLVGLETLRRKLRA